MAEETQLPASGTLVEPSPQPVWKDSARRGLYKSPAVVLMRLALAARGARGLVSTSLSSLPQVMAWCSKHAQRGSKHGALLQVLNCCGG